MSTWDSMSDADYAACVDAGRGMPPDPRELADNARKAAQEGGVSGADHTSGVMRIEYRVLGGHVHCRVFGPFSDKAGDLVFRAEEWDHFQRTNRQWQFTNLDAEGRR